LSINAENAKNRKKKYNKFNKKSDVLVQAIMAYNSSIIQMLDAKTLCINGNRPFGLLLNKYLQICTSSDNMQTIIKAVPAEGGVTISSVAR
jgi:hypothetical protein